MTPDPTDQKADRMRKANVRSQNPACRIQTVIAMLIGSLISSNAWAQSDGFSTLPTVTVTGTREAEKISETPVSVGVVSRESIKFTRPGHPSEILGQVPGVAVGITNGEGHTTAIRQGFTTSPLYLYLEDGIPTRATGNFNHNALFELNLPGAGGIEVIRGIGTALYGSDAIGGIVNVLTRQPAAKSAADASVEFGQHGYQRFLGGIDTGRIGQDAVRGDLNLTHTDGWRIKTGYDRQSLNLRWDREPDDETAVKTILGYSKVDMETGANSALPYDLYVNSPTINLRSPAFRQVEALRISTSVARDLGGGKELTVTPYVRNNWMNLNGSYNFTGDARIEETTVWSYGVLAKLRKDFDDSLRTRLIVGMDFDYSPSERKETKINLTSVQIGPNSLYTQYTGYTLGGVIYDYEANYTSAAPYAHLEISPAEKLRVTMGLRYDYAQYDMKNRLTPGFVSASGRQYYNPAEASVDFSRLSPKLGATYALTAQSHVFVSYNQGFRTPSESQLFRGGRSDAGALVTQQAQARALSNAALNLKAIKAEQYELGFRGLASDWNYEVVGYLLKKKDDLLSQRDSTGFAVQTNNGETEHKGVEIGLGKTLLPTLRFDLAGSYAKHIYTSWVTSTINYSGKEIEASPRLLGNVRLTWKPLAGTTTQLEWVKIGSYFLDQENIFGKYPGHDLFNLRASQVLSKDVSAFARITNLLDKRYSDSASQSSATGGLYSPGLPRTVYAGLEAKW